MGTVVKRGEKWRAVIRRVGHKDQTKTFPTKYAAEKWMRQVESDMDNRQFLIPTKVTGRTIFEKFRDEVADSRAGGPWEKKRINAFLRDMHFLDKALSDIDRFDIQGWRDERIKSVSGSSVCRDMNLASGIITHAMHEWNVTLRVNPFHEVKRPQENPHRTRRPTDAELTALKNHFKFDPATPPTHGKEGMPWMILLAIETAMRLGELGKLKWENVSLEEGYIFVAAEVDGVRGTKNGDDRVVPLSNYATELLRVLASGKQPAGKRAGYVFFVDGITAGVYFRDACKEVGIKDLHFHDLRHEATSRLSRIYDMLDLAKIVGHRDQKNLMIYYNPTPAELVRQLRARQKAA